MNRLLVAVMVAVGMSWGLPGLFECGAPNARSIASAQETWKKEFEDICASADDPMRLSTEKLKGLIGRCDLFVGARTHATIASTSQFVPTIVLAYSTKAFGIMEHVLDRERSVLRQHVGSGGGP